MSAVVSQANKRRSGLFELLRGSPIMGPFAALVLASIFFATQSDKFLTGSNLSLIIQQVMVVGTLAIGQTLVILTGGIDLSNGMIMALSSVLMTGFAVQSGMNPLLAILVGLLAGVVFGLLNGALITSIGLPPFIVTLGTFNIAYALVRIYTTATITNLPSEQLFLGNTFSIAGTEITYGSVLMVILYAITWYILRSTPAGRAVYAVGDNPEAARLAGINTKRVLTAVYTVAAISYGVAGLLLVSRTGVGDPQAGQTGNLDSITAVVLGGTSLLGGRGQILGTLIGALIVGVFRNGLQLMGVGSIYQVLITGILVIVAVSIDYLSHRGK
ncbi:MAG TPA: ABC transporter permease [Kouleothrix sp.]|uniref:ABC transporter permease n=1 Tax=Kouleothrix sp. TaxID=2779161 RepID=UPI002BB14FB2|nr:ABC transporter permease [Kouleothrix sp.]HRC74201.1 ABC transporter permease [Kouleothrix sp.]